MVIGNEEMEKMREIPELYGNAMMAWARAELIMGVLVMRFSENEKILKKLRDPKENDPDAYSVIEELKKHTRKEYEEFASVCKDRLTRLEDIDMQKPGEYSGKSFDDFIQGLHLARKSRNSLAHDIAKMEMQSRHESRNDEIKKLLPPGHLDQMIGLIGVHMEVISRVAVPTIEFAGWLLTGKKVSSIYPPRVPGNSGR